MQSRSLTRCRLVSSLSHLSLLTGWRLSGVLRSNAALLTTTRSESFSSASFVSNQSPHTGRCSGSPNYTVGEENRFDHLELPTRSTYEAYTSNEELLRLLQEREEQVQKLRQIYENFHYEVDKHLRKTILDYHDKAMGLSQVHGRMQHTSLRINREVLEKLREEQEMLTRDKRLIMFLCMLVVFIFWVWVRRHYVRREELEVYRRKDALRDLGEDAYASPPGVVAPSVTGPGYYGGGNWFGNEKRSARYRETAWEKEQRLRAEARRQNCTDEGTA